MLTISPLIRITFGLASLTLVLVLAGDYILELTRSQSGVELRQRERISKTLAVQFSPLAVINDTGTIGKTIEALVERNRDVVSSADPMGQTNPPFMSGVPELLLLRLLEQREM